MLVALLLILGAVWIVSQASTWLRRYSRKEGFNQGTEGMAADPGFLQNEKFLIRRNQDIYDDFTLHYYDRLHRTRETATYIFDAVERLTQANPAKSVILDVGCGTGEMVKYMKQTKGYHQVYGLDRSESAVRIATTAGLPVILGDTMMPMTFDKHTFSHVFLTGMTVYEFQDKVELFRNLYYWLMPNAYLIVQMVDRDRYDPIPPGAKPGLILTTPVVAAAAGNGVRVTDAHVDFVDFIYNSAVNVSNIETTDQVVVKETFTDADTRKVRINEQTLYMETVQDLVYKAQYAGFIVQGQFDLSKCGSVGDAHQYIFVLERPH